MQICSGVDISTRLTRDVSESASVKWPLEALRGAEGILKKKGEGFVFVPVCLYIGEVGGSLELSMCDSF